MTAYQKDIGRQTRENRYDQVKFGRILRVDHENWVVDVVWDQYNSVEPEVSISMPFVTPRAVLGGMPEIGTTMVCDFTYSNPYKAKPVGVTYIAAGFRSGINQAQQSTQKYDIPGFNTPRYRRKFRKLWPGEIIGSSSQGSDWLLDESFSMQDMKGDEIRIDYRDQSINNISINKYSITDAARHSEGWIYRFNQETYDEAGKRTTDGLDEAQAKAISEANHLFPPDEYQPTITDEAGKKRWYRTVSGANSVDDYFISGVNIDAPLVEVRKEIREVGYGFLPLVDQNVDSDQWWDNNKETSTDEDSVTTTFSRGNIIESTSGTLVGYDKTHKNYGKVLRPQIFFNPDKTDLDIRELPILEGQGPDFTPVRYQAAAYMWKMPYQYAQTRMFVTKEGAVHMHVGATHSEADCPFEPQLQHEYGAGRSVEAHFGGSIRAVVDKNLSREESLDLKTIGKVYFHFGKDDGIASNVRRTMSVDSVTYKGGVTIPILSTAPGKLPTARELSIEGVTDGGISLRIGRTHGRNMRQYEMNGFTAEGDHSIADNDVRDVGRGMYQAGDKFYRHHDLTQAGKGAPGRIGTAEEDKRLPDAISNIDLMATSLDAHLVGSAFARVGKDHDGVSLALDAAGALVAWFGSENKDNRSMILSMDGGIEAKIGRMSTSGNSIQAYLEGGISLRVRGNNKGEDFNVVMEGDQSVKYVGRHEVEVQGNLVHKTSVDLIEVVGGVKSTTIMRNQVMGISGARITTIGNVPPGNAAADSLNIFSGNLKVQIETKGDILYETRLGKIVMQTLLGDAEFRTMVGNVIIEAMTGNVLVKTPLTKVGPPLMLKYPVVTAATGCILTGGRLPHIRGSAFMKVADIPPPPPKIPLPPPPLPEI